MRNLERATGLPIASIGRFIPMLTALTVTIAGAVIGIDALTVSGKEAAKASDEAAQSFEDSANKVSGIKKELQDIKDKIDEINKQDKISPTDDANLQKLKTQKELLERDLAIEQKLYKLRQKQNAEQASTAIAQNGSESMDWRHITDNDLSRFGVTDEDRKQAGWKSTLEVADDTGDMSTRWEYDLTQETAAMQSAYNRYIQQQNELKQQLADNGSLTKEQEKQKKQIDKYTEKLEEAIGQNVEELQTYRERLTNSAGQALKGHEDQVFQIDQVLDQYGGIERDPFEDLANHWKELQRLSKTDAGMQTAEMRHFLEVMSGKDLSTADLDALQKTWDKFKNLQTVDFSKMFTGDTQTNLQNFWKMVEKVNSEWAEFDEKTQTWKFNIDSVEELAQKLGISEDLVKNIIKLTNEAGAKIEVQNKDLNGQKVMDSSKAEKTLKKAGIIDKKYNVNLEIEDSSQLLQQIGDITSAIDAFSKKHGKINIDTKEGQAAYSLISQLYDKLIELSNKNNIALHLNTEEIGEGGTKAQKTAKSLHDASAAIVEYQAALLKSEYNPKINVKEFEKKAKEACDAAAADFKALEAESPNLAKALSINADDLDFSAISAKLGDAVDPNVVLEQIRQSIAGMTQDDFVVTLGVKPEAIENYVAEEKETPVKLNVDDSALKTVVDKTYDVSTKIKVTDKSALTGLTTTVSATLKPFRSPLFGEQGFQGNAHAGGKWGTPRDEVALTSELGPEIVVNPKTGRWQTVGDKGAQFTRLPKGAIVFNHKQTEQLLKYGHINSRGKALVGGNAYPTGVQGTWNVGGTNDSGNGSKEQKDAAKETTKTVKEVAKNVKTSTDATKTASDATKTALDKFNDDFSNLTDWVERALESVNKKIEKYLNKAEKKAEAGNYKGAAKQYRKALDTYANAIGKHGNAENVYQTKANDALSAAVSRGLITKEQSVTIQNRVANGSMDVTKLSDSVKAVVEAYQTYHDKARDAADATVDLYDKYEETAQKMYQLPLDRASAKTEKLKNAFDLLEKKLELTGLSTKKAAILEQELGNQRRQHAAIANAYESANSNLRNARHRVNEITDSALNGLSDADKAKVVSKVQNGKTVDITSLTGLTSTGRQAIIEYNAALTAQQDALSNLKVSGLETAASIKELSAELANLAVEKAENKIDQIHKKTEVIDAKLEIADDATEKNRLLGKKTTKAWNEYNARVKAETSIQDEINSRFKGSVKDAAEAQGKSVGEKLSLNGLKKGSKEYKAIAEYNAFIEALPEAHRQTTLAWANAMKTQRDNASQMFDNVRQDAETSKKTIIDAASEVEESYNNLDASALKLMEKDPTLTYDQAILQVMNDAKDKYGAAATAYTEIADTLQQWLDENGKNLSPEDLAAKTDEIAELRKNADAMVEKGNTAAKDINVYNNDAAKRAMDAAQRQYDAIKAHNELMVANGQYNTVGDIENEINAMAELIDADKEYIEAQKAMRDAAVVGSDEWNTYTENIESGTQALIDHTSAMGDLKDSMLDAKNRPVDSALKALQNEADTIQDSLSLAQAAGKDINPSDYYSLIENSKQQVLLLQQQRQELEAELATLDETDARYAEIQQRIWEIDDAIRQADIDQAGWGKSAKDFYDSKATESDNDAADALKKIEQKHLNDIKLRLEKLGAKLNDIYNRMELLKAKGITPGTDLYLEEYKVNRERMDVLKEEIATLEAAYNKPRSDDEDGSEALAAYQEWQSAVQEYNKLMAENITLARVTVRDALLLPLQKEHEKLEHIAAIFEGIADIIDDEMLFNQDGTVSKYGNMKMDLLAGQYQAARSEVQNYLDDIKTANKLINTGFYSAEEGSERINELQEKLIDAMQNQKSLASELADTLKDANEQEIQQLGKIIDARKEALQAKKDYYDYDKTIRDQTKDIQALQAQLAALDGLTDAESKAKRARLQAQLNEAQESLDDTVHDHMFEISQNSLDQLQTTLQDSFEEEWDELAHDLDALIKYANNLADNTDPKSIEAAMSDVFKTFDVDENLAQFGDYFKNMMEPRHQNPYDTKVYEDNLDAIYKVLCQLRDLGALAANVKPEAIYDEEKAAELAAQNLNNGVNQSLTNDDGEAQQEQNTNIIQWFREVFDDLKNLFSNIKSKIKFPSFASGVRRVSKSQLAWTQEHGQEEWIVRPSDGAILTPMTKGSGVLPPDATSKLWALAQGQLPTMQMPKMPTPNFDFSETLSPVVNIDNSMTVEGSVDAAVIGDLKKFKEEQREDIYQYVSDRMFRGYIHSGGKRRI